MDREMGESMIVFPISRQARGRNLKKARLGGQKLPQIVALATNP